MGGPGSGRWKRPGRRTVESCLTLDVNDLSARGYLQPGWLGAYQWSTAGGEVFSIDLHAEAERLHLSWHSCIGGSRRRTGNRERESEQEGEQGVVTEVVSIVRVPHYPSGSRAYFICPGGGAAAGGVAGCGRRVVKLYFSHGRFLCRHCSQLTYASQYEQPWQRALRRANKLQQRLALTGSVSAPEKPKGMLVSAYAQLLESVLQAEMRATEAGTDPALAARNPDWKPA